MKRTILFLSILFSIVQIYAAGLDVSFRTGEIKFDCSLCPENNTIGGRINLFPVTLLETTTGIGLEIFPIEIFAQTSEQNEDSFLFSFLNLKLFFDIFSSYDFISFGPFTQINALDLNDFKRFKIETGMSLSLSSGNLFGVFPYRINWLTMDFGARFFQERISAFVSIGIDIGLLLYVFDSPHHHHHHYH